MSEKNVLGEDRTGNPFHHEACDFDSMTSIVKVHGRKTALILMQIQPFRCFSEEETGKRASGIPFNQDLQGTECLQATLRICR